MFSSKWHIFALFFCALPSCFGAESLVVAHFTQDCPADTDTFINVPVHRPSVFKGVVESVEANAESVTLSLSGEPNFTADQFVYGVNGNKDKFYIKFVCGNLEGAYFDIESNGAFSLEIEIGVSEAQSIKQGDEFIIVPHWTLNTLFPNGKGLYASTLAFAAGASKLMFFDSNTQGANFSVNKVYYYFKNASTEGWRQSGNSGAGSMADVIVPPNEFFIFRNDGADKNSKISFSGVVDMCAQTLILKNLSLTEYQDNIIAFPSCTPLKLSQLGAECVKDDFFRPSRMSLNSAGGDTILAYSTSLGKNKSADILYYYNNGHWYRSGKVLADNDVIPSNIAIVRRIPRTQITAQRSAFSPDYAE